MPRRVASAPYFGDEIHRIDDVAEALGHLAAFVVEHERRDEHITERNVAREFHSEHHHARDPQEDDLASRDERGIGIPVLHLGRLFCQPRIENGQRPLENHVSSVSGSRRNATPPYFSLEISSASSSVLGDDHVFVRRVPNGKLMAPPHLSRDVPIPGCSRASIRTCGRSAPV